MAESKAVLAASAAINRGHSFAEELRRHLQAVQAAKQQDLAKLTATSPIKVTISSGGVWLAPTTNMQLSAALDTADKRLYAAKRAGRDQVCFS